MERLKILFEESKLEMNGIIAEREIQKKLEKDAETNARLIDDLNSESTLNHIVKPSYL